MSYSHTYTPKVVYPLALRYANVASINATLEQMILLDCDQYNLALVVPREVIPFDIAVPMKNIVVPESKTVRSAYIIAKNNVVLIRKLCFLFNDETWKSQCTGKISEDTPELPRILVTEKILVNGIESLVEVVEYTKASVVLFGPTSLETQFTSAISRNNYVHPNGEKKKGFMVAKNSKSIEEFKTLFPDIDLESLYLIAGSGKTSTRVETPGLPRILASAIITTETDSFTIEVAEYSPASVVLFAPSAIESRLNGSFSPSNFQHPTRGRIPGYVCSKSTSRIEEFKKLFSDSNFECSYLHPIASKGDETPKVITSVVSTPAVVKQPLHMEIFNILSKLGRSSDLVVQEILAGNMMIYGDVDVVDAELAKYTISKHLGTILFENKKCVYFQAVQEEF